MNRLELTERLHSLAQEPWQHRFAPTIVSIATTGVRPRDSGTSFLRVLDAVCIWSDAPHGQDYLSNIYYERLTP